MYYPLFLFAITNLHCVSILAAASNLFGAEDLTSAVVCSLQADTYRRMMKATKGEWAAFHPRTNCLWIYYLADTMLRLKDLSCTADQKKQFKEFRHVHELDCYDPCCRPTLCIRLPATG
jgi:serine/threonine-protein kinase haspin